MKMKKETKQAIMASLGTILLIVGGIQANKYIVEPGISWVKGKMAKTPTVTPPAAPKV